ncbi:hypothetical protein F5Y10DRAFT_239748 [Nemania abortiva]|nr:hypothetical protein F5Y10DRAFT_239748 [Nemania abortiva]
MPSSESLSSYWLHWRSASGAKVHGADVEPDRFNFLSFLATAQALRIEFLPLVWDSARGIIGTGGTSRIHQALVNLDTSFAFKAYHTRNQTEEQVFRTLITEITVLSQPFVREHPNISQLQGICWDISPQDDKPWPVLVFEKSHLGDLYHFVSHGGRDMTFHERLKLCVDVGRAIVDMHSNCIVHGDIKPENVLVFREKSGEYRARVTDFGYSTRYLRNNQRLTLPRSEPWNAPENDGRRRVWLPSDALKADLFCFGMLAFWLLFETFLSGVTPRSHNVGVPNIGFPRPAEATLHAIKGDLPRYAQHLLTSEMALEDEEKMILRDFFQSSLSQVSAWRAMGCLQAFIERLDPQWKSTRVVAPFQGGEENIYDSDFKIINSIYDFYRSDYRIRSYIARCLLNSYSQSTCVAFQAAVCYYIGFGVARNGDQAKEILGRSQTIQTIRDMVSSLGPESRGSELRAPVLSDLHAVGAVRWDNFTDVYLEQERLNEAEARLMQEKDDLSIVLSTDHDLIRIVKANLSAIYDIGGQWDKAEKLKVEVMEINKQKLGTDHPFTLNSVANLASTYWDQGRWDEAEKLQVEVTEISRQQLGTDHPFTITSMANLAVTYQTLGQWDKSEKLEVEVMEISEQKFGKDHPDTLASIANLASTYQYLGQWDRAEKLAVETIKTCQHKLQADHPLIRSITANLASTYRYQGRWDESEKLEVEVLEARKQKLGADHPSTLTSMANLAASYWGQGRWDESEKLEMEVLEVSKQKLGADHPSTLTSMSNLAGVYWNQGRWVEAEKLKLEVIKARTQKLGADHPSTLGSIANLASVYRYQGRWDEAEKLQGGEGDKQNET